MLDYSDDCPISMNYGYDPQCLDPLRLQYGLATLTRKVRLDPP
jgi:hypothetical protein